MLNEVFLFMHLGSEGLLSVERVEDQCECGRINERGESILC